MELLASLGGEPPPARGIAFVGSAEMMPPPSPSRRLLPLLALLYSRAPPPSNTSPAGKAERLPALFLGVLLLCTRFRRSDADDSGRGTQSASDDAGSWAHAAEAPGPTRPAHGAIWARGHVLYFLLADRRAVFLGFVFLF